ncbi:PEP-CTERM sorting domain-containing protein [Psychrosphaera aestuarii]|uniref:PEP-CTERM sorting domain-containing protein n=1 Tax=Psychrosphaera aestuarii TaxID=1266052 RepID=UPI001B3198D8|nr:PEP-CTERM sorting domain-containing protein [Psychrosphaera aestuarii]
MNIIKNIGLALLFVVSTNVSAGLISDYVLDGTTNTVFDNRSGLEWLRWDQTDGMTIQQALSAYNSGGWQLASNAQAAYLFNTFDLSYGTFTWSEEESFDGAFNSSSNGLIEAADDRELMLVNLFGITYEEYNMGIDPPDGMQYSAAFFGSDLNRDGGYKRMWVMDDYGVNQSSKGRAKFDIDNYTNQSRTRTTGVALVRSAPVTIFSSLETVQPTTNSPAGSTISVNEPTTLGLLALAILGVGVRRNRQR